MDTPEDTSEFGPEAEETPSDSSESPNTPDLNGSEMVEGDGDSQIPIEDEADSSTIEEGIDEQTGGEEETFPEKAAGNEEIGNGDPEAAFYEDELLDEDDVPNQEASDTGIEKPQGIDFILNLPLELTVEYGRANKKIAKLLDFQQGTVIELSKLKGEPVDILANDKLIAKGEVVVENDKYAIRITEIISRLERIKRL